MLGVSTTQTGIRRIETARGHRYTIDGRDAPGVTTLIGQGIPKPAMPYWAANSVAQYVVDAPHGAIDGMRANGEDSMYDYLKRIPWVQRDQAAVRGTDVHKIAEKLITGQEVEVPDHLAGYVTSAVRFMDDWRIAPVKVEAVVASRRWLYCGTADLICDLPDGRRGLFDYKTARKGIYPEAALQLAAYRHADAYLADDGIELPISELQIDCAYAVWLREDGYDVIPVETSLEVFEFFLHAAFVGRHLAHMGAWLGAPEVWRAES